MNGQCRLCGQTAEGLAFGDWVKATFTDWDKLLPGQIICHPCLFWFNEASPELAARVGKDKPQRMRNYSHFIVNGAWLPLSKGDKARMRDLLLHPPFPELAVVADSGQKHIAFRAVRNAPGNRAGWVQFETQRIWVAPAELDALLRPMTALLAAFSKAEIETGHYARHRILKFGISAWHEQETALKAQRGSGLFQLAIFLAQHEEDSSGRSTASPSGAGGSAAHADLAGHPDGLQKPLPEDDLGTVREPDTERGVHEQPGEVRQLPLF